MYCVSLTDHVAQSPSVWSIVCSRSGGIKSTGDWSDLIVCDTLKLFLLSASKDGKGSRGQSGFDVFMVFGQLRGAGVTLLFFSGPICDGSFS